jgi:hypothetical protein
MFWLCKNKDDMIGNISLWVGHIPTIYNLSRQAKIVGCQYQAYHDIFYQINYYSDNEAPHSKPLGASFFVELSHPSLPLCGI